LSENIRSTNKKVFFFIMSGEYIIMQILVRFFVYYAKLFCIGVGDYSSAAWNNPPLRE